MILRTSPEASLANKELTLLSRKEKMEKVHTSETTKVQFMCRILSENMGLVTPVGFIVQKKKNHNGMHRTIERLGNTAIRYIRV